MTRVFRVRERAVASEIIDGEAIIMQLRTGHYFSARNTGAVIWSLFTRGVHLPTVSRLMADATGAPIDEVEARVSDFAADAERHMLGAVEEVADEAAGIPPQITTIAVPAHWVTPVLEVFSGMQDLLLLDPIHDVSEEAGWPMQKPAA